MERKLAGGADLAFGGLFIYGNKSLGVRRSMNWIASSHYAFFLDPR